MNWIGRLQLIPTLQPTMHQAFMWRVAGQVTLHDYATLLPEALAALEAREAALAHTWELEDDLAFKQHQLTQLNSEPGHEEKKARLTNGIKHLEAQIKASHDRYLLLQQRNQAELR
eukprot:1158376-Pelagomonas_calceolata.AAC.3